MKRLLIKLKKLYFPRNFEEMMFVFFSSFIKILFLARNILPLKSCEIKFIA